MNTLPLKLGWLLLAGLLVLNGRTHLTAMAKAKDDFQVDKSNWARRIGGTTRRHPPSTMKAHVLEVH
jgi:hypothetical protein